MDAIEETVVQSASEVPSRYRSNYGVPEDLPPMFDH